MDNLGRVRPQFIVSAGRVVDGHRDVTERLGAAVVIGEGRIVALGPTDEVRRGFPALPVSDFPTGTLLPGLIDCHVHLTMPGDGSSYEVGAKASQRQRHLRATTNARRHLLAGVTTLRDLGSHRDLFEWRANSRAESLPRVILYGRPLTGKRGHMNLYGGTCEGVAEVAARASENLDMGSDGIKIVASGGGTLGTRPWEASFSAKAIRAAVDVAHNAGKLITAHALAIDSIRRAINAGVDGIEHIAFLGRDNQPALNDSLAELIVKRAITFGSTLGVNYRYLGLASADIVSDYELSEQQNRTGYYLENARQVHALGARIVAASDSGWKYTLFGEFDKELDLLHRAGLATREVIHAATAGAADHLRLPSLGRLAPGYEADMIVVDGNPIADVTALKSVSAVYRAGRRVAV